jgi:hypothetical protein
VGWCPNLDNESRRGLKALPPLRGWGQQLQATGAPKKKVLTHTLKPALEIGYKGLGRGPEGPLYPIMALPDHGEIRRFSATC